MDSNTNLASAIDTTRTGRSSWRQFMMAGFVFLLIECLLADRLRAKRLEHSSQTEDSRESLPETQDA